MFRGFAEVRVGFLGLRRAKWKHPDAEVRLRAVPELGASATSALSGLALHDPDPRVRAAAAQRVGDAATLTRLQQQGDEAVRRIARERLGAAAGRLLRTEPLANCHGALDTLADQKTLSELVLTAVDPAVRSAALAKMLALPEPSQALLTTIAIQDASGESALRALAGIERRASLKDIARKAKDARVRAAAAEREGQRVVAAERPSTERQRKSRAQAIDPLVAAAMRLAVSSDAVAAEEELPGLAQRWQAALDLATGVEQEPAVTAALARWERVQREIHEQAGRERTRRAEARAERERLLAELEAAAPPPAQRQAWDGRWQACAALPASELAALEQRYAGYWPSARPQVAGGAAADPDAAAHAAAAPVLPAEASAELEALLAQAEQLSLTDAFQDAVPTWHQLHKRWMMLSEPLSDRDPLRARFHAAWSQFKLRRREARESRVANRQQRAEQLAALLAEAEVLAQTAAQVPADDQGAIERQAGAVRELQQRWRTEAQGAGAGARGLRPRFQAAMDAAYAPVAANREAEDWQRLHHLAGAEELIAQVEGLAAESDLEQVLDGVKSAHRAWKRLGPLPRQRQQAVWVAFKAACDTQFDRARPYLAAQDEARQQNLEKKRALVAEAEALAKRETIGLVGSPADIAARRAAGERIKALQQEWRGIGPVPREHDRELMTAFRAAGDQVFSHLREQDAARRQEEAANLARKEALIQQALEFAARAEAARSGRTGIMTAHDIARQARVLQEGFRAIGYVPREQVESVRTRFIEACDRIWATIKEERDAEAASEAGNLAQKLQLIASIEEILSGPNPRWYKDEVRALAGKWRDIGPVPQERVQELNRRFDDLVRKVRDER
jgi:hypothetical protein